MAGSDVVCSRAGAVVISRHSVAADVGLKVYARGLVDGDRCSLSDYRRLSVSVSSLTNGSGAGDRP
jgi:hypothetical protein